METQGLQYAILTLLRFRLLEFDLSVGRFSYELGPVRVISLRLGRHSVPTTELLNRFFGVDDAIFLRPEVELLRQPRDLVLREGI